MRRIADNATMKRISRLACVACLVSSVPAVCAQPSSDEQMKQEAWARQSGEALLNEEVRGIEQARQGTEEGAAERARENLAVQAADAQALGRTAQQVEEEKENKARSETEAKLAEQVRQADAEMAELSARRQADAGMARMQSASLSQQDGEARIAVEAVLGVEAKAEVPPQKDAEAGKQENASREAMDRAEREQAVSRALAEAQAKISVQDELSAKASAQAVKNGGDEGRAALEAQERAQVAERGGEEDGARAEAAVRMAALNVLPPQANESDAAALRADEEKNKALSQAMLNAEQARVRDEGAILNLYLAAAMRGNSDAQAGLGRMYLQGQGVEADWVQAYKWFDLAATGGDREAASDMKSLEGKMSREQIEQAKKLAQGWPETHR